MSKVSNDFYLTEFVPKEIYSAFGENAIWFTNPVMIILMQFFRDRYKKPITINNWYDKGPYNYRGYRPKWCNGGADSSQHRLANAEDFTVEGMSPAEVRADIMANEKLFYDVGLRAIEHGDDAPTWVHVDGRNSLLVDKILVVHAKKVNK